MTMEMLVENWYLILAAIVVLAFAAYGVYHFVKLPANTRLRNVKEWLKWAVSEAEKELGSGTGQLKLRLVYNMAVEKFPWIISAVTFDKFSDWVDLALDWMRDQLEKNKDIKSVVTGESEDDK